MGSLFKSREWWTTQVADECDCNSLLLANIDNSPSKEDKVVVGGLSGIIRLFGPSNGIQEYQATDLLLESDLSLPILQVAAGLFLAGSDLTHLAILHPRKLSVFSVSGTGGFSEHGSSYNIQLIYEHKLQRSSYNMVVGTFGHVQGRDYFCIQSLDGTLSFFEQENFAFTRFLPNFLLPGSLCYLKKSDSFVTCTSSGNLESYRYQILAIARDEEKQDMIIGSSSETRGRRVTPDWTIVLGETIRDLKELMLENQTEVVIALGEKNLFVINSNGSYSCFSHKLETSPSCMFVHSCQESIIIVIAFDSKEIHVYKDSKLVWACHSSFAPIAMARGCLVKTCGIVVMLSDNGHLACSYLGTNPSVNTTSLSISTNEAIDHTSAAQELHKLNKAIAVMEDDMNSILSGQKKSSGQEEVELRISEVEILSDNNNKVDHGIEICCPVLLLTRAKVFDLRVTVNMSKPLKCDRNVLIFEILEASSQLSKSFLLKLCNLYLPSSLKVIFTVSFTTSSGMPRVIEESTFLPLHIICKPTKPLKDNDLTISLDILCNVSTGLSELLADLNFQEHIYEDSSQNEIGIEFLAPQIEPVAIFTVIKSPQQKFRIRSDSFEGLSFVTMEVIRRLESRQLKFDVAVIDRERLSVLNSYFKIMDDHHSSRIELKEIQEKLSKYVAQLRVAEKRFLVKLKDRNPAPLNNLDILLQHLSTRTSTISDRMVRAVEQFERKNNSLSFATQLLVQLLSISSGLKKDQKNILLSYLECQLVADLDEGWEERVEAALAEVVKDNDRFVVTGNLQDSKDTTRLKALITSLVDLLAKGDIFTVRNVHHIDQKTSPESPPPGSQNKHNYLNPATEVIPEEEEEEKVCEL